MSPQRPQPNPKNALKTRTLRSPQAPHPQSQTLHCVTPPFDCRVCPAEQVGLAWLKYRGGLPAHSRWRQSREHCSPGSIRTAAAEDGGALRSLREVIPYVCTSAGVAETWETARAQTRAVEFTGSLRTTPKTLCGHSPETIDRL